MIGPLEELVHEHWGSFNVKWKSDNSKDFFKRFVVPMITNCKEIDEYVFLLKQLTEEMSQRLDSIEKSNEG